MLKPTKYMLSVGSLLVIIGACSGYWGGVGIRDFLANMHTYDFTFRVLAKVVVIPHVLLLVGIGLLMFGSVLIGRGIVFEVQNAPKS